MDLILSFVLGGVVFGVILWFAKYTKPVRCTSQVQLIGKTAIVTGSNTGIGFYTALDLAHRGARVILACRDAAKAKQACDKIINASGNKNVTVKHLDLASLKSVRNFAAEILQKESRLDILINNAGVTAMPKFITEDGLEVMFAVNHFSPFFLTNLLLDKMKKSAPSRIVNVSSVVHCWGKIDFENLRSEKKFRQFRIYNDSKLANVIFTRELGRRLSGTGVNAYCLHPGSVQTDLLRHLPYPLRILFSLISSLFFKTAEEGAQTSIYCAVSEDVSAITGKYFVDCKLNESKANPMSLDEGLGKKLWEISEQFTGLAAKE